MTGGVLVHGQAYVHVQVNVTGLKEDCFLLRLQSCLGRELRKSLNIGSIPRSWILGLKANGETTITRSRCIVLRFYRGIVSAILMPSAKVRQRRVLFLVPGA